MAVYSGSTESRNVDIYVTDKNNPCCVVTAAFAADHMTIHLQIENAAEVTANKAAVEADVTDAIADMLARGAALGLPVGDDA